MEYKIGGVVMFSKVAINAIKYGMKKNKYVSKSPWLKQRTLINDHQLPR